MPNSLFADYDLSKFQIKKLRKDAERQELIDRLSEATGRPKRGVYFQTIHFPTSWLKDALEHCIHYSNPAMRNKMFSDFIAQTKK